VLISANVDWKPIRNLLANNRLLLVLWLVEHFGARPFFWLQENNGYKQTDKNISRKGAVTQRKADSSAAFQR